MVVLEPQLSEERKGAVVPSGDRDLCADLGDYQLQLVANVVVDKCCAHTWERRSGEGDVVYAGIPGRAVEVGAMWAMAKCNK